MAHMSCSLKWIDYPNYAIYLALLAIGYGSNFPLFQRVFRLYAKYVAQPIGVVWRAGPAPVHNGWLKNR